MKSRAVLNYKNVNECCSHFSVKKAFNLQFKKKSESDEKISWNYFFVGINIIGL
jgi:hypothetical protein